MKLGFVENYSLWLTEPRVAFLVIALMVAGCDSGPPTAPVHGTVTYNGKTIGTGTVKFYPAEGGRPAVGGIQSDGTYTLARKVPGDQVVLGEYKVTIEATEVSETQSDDAPKSLTDEISTAESVAPRSQVKYLVPQKYSTIKSSGLTASVEAGDNTIDFNLE